MKRMLTRLGWIVPNYEWYFWEAKRWWVRPLTYWWNR